MTSAVPSDESERLALLQTSKLLDSDTAPAFDALARLVATQLECPVAMINLIDSHRVWGLAQVGISLKQCSREGSFCGRTIERGVPLEVADTFQDARFLAHPLVTDAPFARFYVGIPLMVHGLALGTICAMDSQPRTLLPAQWQVLKDLSQAASSLIEARIDTQRFRRQEARVRNASLASSDWLWETDDQGAIQWVSASLMLHTSLNPAAEVGLTVRDIYTPREDETRASWERFLTARTRREPFSNAIADRETPRGKMTVSISGAPVFNQAGRFMGYRGASRNVTRQLAEEKQARQDDLLLRQAIDSFNAGVMISAPDGRVLLCNTAWRRRMGVAVNESCRWPDLLRRRIAEGMYPDAVGRETEFFQWRMNMVELSEPQEIRMRDVWVLARDHRLPDGNVVHFSININETKRHAEALALQTQALTESEARLNAVLRALPDVWFVIDAEGRYNAGHEGHPLLARPFSQIKGRPMGTDAPPELARLESQAVARAQATGELQHVSYSLHVGGRLRHFEARVSPMPDGQTLFLARDMTDRHEAAEKLRVSEELYRSAAATISDGLIVVHLDGRIATMNSAACRIHGVLPNELGLITAAAPQPYDILSDDLREPLPREQWPIIQALQTRAPVDERVLPLRQRNGSVVWMRMSCRPLRVSAQEQPFAVVATCRDITQDRLAAQALALSEERWKFALDGAGDGVWDWDFSTDRMFYSHRLKSMLGYEDAEIGDSVDELTDRIHHDDRPNVVKAFEAYLLHDHGLFQAEFRMRHKQGHDVWILSRGRIVSRDDGGRPLRMVGTHSDVTPIKQAEEVLRDKRTAEAASAAKSEFLSRMSHEVRTPLNAINGFAQLLKLQLNAPEAAPHRGFVDHILHASQHLMALVNDVLDLQQVETGLMALHLEPLALADEVQHCLTMLQPLALQRNVTLVADFAPHLLVRADRQRLRQILINLGSNAIKYNRSGGSVWLGADEVKNSCVTLVIQDSGPGMSPQQLRRLFQPFERLGRETTSIEGSGLGLIITRSLIEAMGGTMDIRSQPGSGTRVNVVLTSHEHSPPPDTGQQSLDLPEPNRIQDVGQQRDHSMPRTPLHVLYVEDNRINAMLFEEALRPYTQLSLDVAEDGQTALTLAAAKLPGVLVLDAHLPGMSGFDVLHALRTALPQLAQVPAFMCSADAMPADVERAQAAGFTGYWTKPIDIQQITTVLCELAAQGNASDS